MTSSEVRKIHLNPCDVSTNDRLEKVIFQRKSVLLLCVNPLIRQGLVTFSSKLSSASSIKDGLTPNSDQLNQFVQQKYQRAEITLE
jgi:hypothetical protein